MTNRRAAPVARRFQLKAAKMAEYKTIATFEVIPAPEKNGKEQFTVRSVNRIFKRRGFLARLFWKDEWVQINAKTHDETVILPPEERNADGLGR